MHIEQPTLSRRIAQLEDSLGFPLLRRETRPVQLTPEGKILYDQWRTIIAQLDHALDLAANYHVRNQKKLTVCSLDSCALFYEFPIISSMMRDIEPDLSISYEYGSLSQWQQRLSTRLADIALTVGFTIEPADPRFDYEVISTAPLLACVLKGNPLSRKTSITYDDIRDQVFITIDSIEFPDHENYLRKICGEHGFKPRIGRKATNALGLPSLLQHDNEVLICDKYLRGYNNSLFRVFELPGTSSDFIAVWLKENKSPFIKPFIEKLREVAFN